MLDDLTYKDPARIWSASSAVAHLRDPQELDRLAQGIAEIRWTTKGEALGGALYPNAERLRFVLRKLEYHRDRVGCLCRLYLGYLMYDPHKEAAAGNIRIEGHRLPGWQVGRRPPLRLHDLRHTLPGGSARVSLFVVGLEGFDLNQCACE